MWFYRLRGYRIIGVNVRRKEGEIDIVARRGRMLAICEVKTRQSTRFGEGWESVDKRKERQLSRLADYYVAKFPDCQIRYDILSLLWTGWRFKVTYFHDAFRG